MKRGTVGVTTWRRQKAFVQSNRNVVTCDSNASSRVFVGPNAADHFSWIQAGSKQAETGKCMHVERRYGCFPALAVGQTERVNGAQTVLLSLHSVLIRAGSRVKLYLGAVCTS